MTAPEIKAERTGAGHNKYGRLLEAHRQNSPGGQWKNYESGTDIRHWDVAPPKEYFAELARISKNQIIWGGNYFDLPPTRCFLVWRKLTISEKFTMAMCEYAWTSFNDNAKWFECAPQGTTKSERFHPTQKPVALYRWVFQNYAHEGDKIFDSHLGSGSSRIAAYDLGLEFVGCEIDEYYFAKQEERFAKHTAQQRIELPSQLPPKVKQTSIFDEGDDAE